MCAAWSCRTETGHLEMNSRALAAATDPPGAALRRASPPLLVMQYHYATQ